MKHPFRKQDRPGSFLPADYVTRKNESRANVLCLSLFGAVMCGVVGAFFVTNRQWLTVRKEQQIINVQYAQEAQKIEQLKQLETQRAEMLEKAEITTALLERVPRSVLLAELVQRMPATITLLDLGLEAKRIADPKADPKTGKPTPGTLSKAPAPGAKPGAPAPEIKPKPTAPKFDFSLKLQGVARVNNDVADYLRYLKECPLLTNVELTYIKERTIEDTALREFEITAKIRPDADARSIEPVARLQQGVHGTGSAISDANQSPVEQEK